jgi:flagellar hook-associated protein 2
MSEPISYVSGLASGIDWRDMVDQLIAVDHKSVDLLVSQKDEYGQKISAWQEIQNKLLALRTASQALNTEEGFSEFKALLSGGGSIDTDQILMAEVGSNAAEGNFSIEVKAKAQAQKVSSQAFASDTQALGVSGEILVNGKAVQIGAADSLQAIRDKINAVNLGQTPSGVSAAIVQYGASDYRLNLTGDQVGADGFSLLNAEATDVLGALGWTDATSAVKNAIQGGAKSDGFTSSSTAIGTLLDLSNAQSGTVTVDGAAVDIDLSTDSLTDIRDAIIAQGKQASLVTETTDDNQTVYRLLVETQSFTDDNNVLETLGVLSRGHDDVVGLRGDAANTTAGSAITAGTLIKEIDGYTDYLSGDTITVSGTDHDGVPVGPSVLNVTDATTVQDLLDEIEGVLGNVSATVTADGEIEVEDLQSGESSLTLTLTPSSAKLSFGTFGAADTLREREIQAGTDAEVAIDGVSVTRSTNHIDDVIAGVTLDVVGAAEGTTLQLQVQRDLEAVQGKVQGFVDAYNEVVSWIAQQFTYDADNEKTGGVLYGDSTLRGIRSRLQSLVINRVWGMNDGFETLALAGIGLNSTNQLTIDSAKLNGYLQTNFEDIEALFAAKGSASEGLLEYLNHSDDTQAGAYSVEITQAATQTTVTGGNDLSGGLSADEEVTVTDGASGRQAVISLSAGWDLDAIVAAINSELAARQTEVHRGSNATGYSETTGWSGVGGADDGDLITFSGTNRYGQAVTGSYSVDTDESLSHLMNAVEDAFGDQVSAGLDTGGRLVITDRSAGDSRITFAIDTSSVAGLDFGTVSVETEGRYALPITASQDGDRLKLTHQDFGSGHGITTSESGGTELGLGGAATVVQGVDVAGTINGATATGSGRILELDQEGNNADGLTLYYSGDSSLSTTFTLTLGVGELFSRELGSITDSSDGTIHYRTDSLDRTIDRLDDRIERMEARLEQKRQSLIQQFTTMEKTLGTLQSQMNWLSSEISGYFSQ